MSEQQGEGKTFAVCVFCGSRDGVAPEHRRLAEDVGRRIARRGWTVVYGGGDVGLMGGIAGGALEAGGKVVGIIPRALLRQEHGKFEISRLEVVDTMAVRKERMIAIADGFLALPGGLGTLDELFEVLTLRQIGLHRKPVAILDYGGYFRNLLAAMETMAEHGFVAREHIDHLIVKDSVDPLLDALAAAAD
jgi:uncharacterized protein (TIGR00730 family)